MAAVTSAAATMAAGADGLTVRPADPVAGAGKWQVLLVVGTGLFLTTQGAGIVTVALPVLAREFGGTLADRFGARRVAALGQAIAAVGLVSLVFLPERPADGDTFQAPLRVAVSLGVIGAGQVLFNVPNSAALFDAAPASRMGLVGGLWALSRTFGGAIGQATAGVLWSVVVVADAGGTTPIATQAPSEAMLSGFRAAFGCGALVSLAALLVWLYGSSHVRKEART